VIQKLKNEEAMARVGPQRHKGTGEELRMDTWNLLRNRNTNILTHNQVRLSMHFKQHDMKVNEGVEA